MQTRFKGTIEQVRAIEDCIRATKKYTEGVSTLRKRHPVQGEDFNSRVLTKIYEVYPETEISWNMSVNTAIDWLWSDTPCVMATFLYDYRSNNAHVDVEGDNAVKQLQDNIPGLADAVNTITAKTEKAQKALEAANGAGKSRRFPTHIHARRPVEERPAAKPG